MADQRKAVNPVFILDHYQIFSSWQISKMPQARFEPVQNLSSGFVASWESTYTVIFMQKYSARDGHIWKTNNKKQKTYAVLLFFFSNIWLAVPIKHKVHTNIRNLWLRSHKFNSGISFLWQRICPLTCRIQ